MILSAALRFPVAVGVNCTLTVQEAPEESATPKHVSAVLTKSAALLPVMSTPVMAMANEPLLVTVTVCAALGAFRS